MPAEIRNNFSAGMDRDTSYYLLPKNRYIDALNITRDAVVANQDNIVSNLVGSRILQYNYPSHGTGVIAFSQGQNPFTHNSSAIGTITGTPSDTLAVTITISNLSVGDFVRGNIGSSIFVNDITTTTTYSLTLDGTGIAAFNLFLNGSATVTISITSGGTNTTIGAVANPIRNTVISFVYNTSGFHSIVEYNLTSRTAVKVFENLTDSDGTDILGFTLTGKICNANILNRPEGDLLFFLDSLGRPTFMNLTSFKAGLYTPVTRQIIDVVTNWCPTPPTSIYGNDTSTVSNFLQKKLFRFIQRFVYDDNTKSIWGPVSAVPLPANILDSVFTNVVTNNNFVAVSLQSGAKNVKAVELAVSIQNNQNIWNPFGLVKSFDKDAESIDDDATFSYNFYNNSAYATVDIDEQLLLFDWIPLYATSQEMPNGNVLAYAGITEGYDRTLDPNVVITVNTIAAGSGSAVGSLSLTVYAHIDNSLNHLTTVGIKVAGTPAVGTQINISIERKSDSAILLGATYITVVDDTAATVATALKNNANAAGILNSANSFPNGNLLIDYNNSVYWEYANVPTIIQIIAPTGSATTNSIATWPFSGQRRVGISYYNEKGRTNGILYDAAITFPPYNENGSQQVLLPYINIKIYHRPPDWTYSYQICFTQDPTPILYIETIHVQTDSNFIYFEITNLSLNQRKNPTTATVVSWTFQDGDRMRLIRRMSDAFVFGPSFNTGIEGIVSDPMINNVVQTGKTFVKIKKAAPFASETYASDLFIIQLFRPTLQQPNDTNAVFFECSVEFPINNPTTENRTHGGQITDQSIDLVTPAEINIYQGDVYFRIRNEYLSETGIGTFNVQDRNFVDFFTSAVSNLDGRSIPIDPNARQSFFGALIRYSQAYEPNTNINGLNRFFPGNFLECDDSYGIIQRMKVRARFMRIYQELRVGVIFLFSKIGKSPTGDEVTVVTDQLLNPVEYYQYQTGIGSNKESLASFNDADYFTSNITGGIYRCSLDGIIPLHIKYFMNSWSIDNLPLRTGQYKVYGAFDQKLNNYIIALEQVGSSSADTLNFHEPDNTFDSFWDLHPEYMVTIQTLLCSFNQGQMWTHDSDVYNNWFGVQYDSFITPVFNDGSASKKQFMSLIQSSSSLWTAPEIITQTKSYGTTNQQSTLVAAEFKLLEGQFSTSFRRDINSRGGKINGSSLKGNWMTIKLQNSNASVLVTLDAVIVKVINSPVNVV